MKTKLLFIAMTLISVWSNLTAQTIVFDGETSSDWNTAENWVGDVLPGTNNDVDLDGNTVVLSANVQVQRVYAGGSSNLTIDNEVTLVISDFAGGDDGLEVQNSGTVINNGTITISNIDAASTDADGLYNKGTFINNGSIIIDGVGQHGMYLQQGTFTNSATGTITIMNTGQGDSGADYVYMDDNKGTISNFNNFGSLAITMTGNDDGIYIKDGCVLTNHSTGTIDIISTGGGDMPLHIVGGSSLTTPSKLDNAGTVIINGTGTSDYGVQVDGANATSTPTETAILINSGTLTINDAGDNASDDGIRIRRSGVITNSAGGVININNAKDEGIQIEDESLSTGVFNNSGTVNITSAADHGMECFGTFNNLNGGVFNATNCSDDGIRLQNDGVFNNDGAIGIDGSGSEDIETETVASFINTANSTFAPGSSLGDLEIRDDFDLGAATVTFEINGTTAGTDYDQIKASTSSNTFTVGPSTKINLVWGYTPSVGDKFDIIDVSGTLSGAIDILNVTSSHDVTVTVVGNDLEVEVIAPVTSTTWTAGTDTDWATASNWDNGVPTSSIDATIPDVTNAPIISSSTGAQVNNLTITEPDGLTINSGGSIIVSGTSSGNITYNRTLDTDNWYLVSSPVVGETYDDAYVTANGIASGTQNTNSRGIALFTTSNDSWDYMQAGETATFSAGTGYSVKRSSAGDVSFTGTLNVDNAGVDVALSSDGNRFNLLGNPYTSHISSATFLANESAVSETQTLWVWDQAQASGSGAYEVKTLADAMVIAPAQGFFVRANAAGGTFNFAETNQASSGGTFQRTDTRPEIYLTISNQTEAREAKIYYIENMTTGFDVGYEGELFNGVSNPLAIYTHLIADSEGKNYQVQSLPPNNYENMIIPIGINAEAGTAITIDASTNNFPSGINIYLEDKQENTFTLLEADANFSITPENSLSGIGRFYLHTTSGVLSADDFDTNNNISIYTSSNDNLRIAGVQNGTATVRLYNILGKEMLKSSFVGSGVNDIKVNDIPIGIYIVKLTTENGTLNRKIIIQY